MQTIYFNRKHYRKFDHLYYVAKDGSLLRKFKPIKPQKRKDGYYSVGKRLIHRMVATCWVPNPNNCKHIHHIDKDKSNNNYENLIWLTPKRHIADKHPRPKGIYHMSEEGKQKLRNFRLGKKHTAETKQKISYANQHYSGKPRGWKPGMKHTDETILKMSKNSKKARPCMIYGIRYKSFTEAGAALNIKPLTLRKRCLSKNFHDYKLV